MPGRSMSRRWPRTVFPSPVARWAASRAGRPPRRTCKRSTAWRRPSPTCSLGGVPARLQERAAGRRPVGGGLLRADAGRHRGPRDGLAVAGARCVGERAAGLFRRTRREPLGGAALRPGRSNLGQLPARAYELRAAARARQRIHGLLPALLRASPARHRQARRPVRGHDGDAPRGAAKCGACAWWSTGARVRLARPGAASHPSRR